MPETDQLWQKVFSHARFLCRISRGNEYLAIWRMLTLGFCSTNA